MQINAINSAIPNQACQPIKPEYSGHSFKSTKAADSQKQDSFVLEQKYNLACQLAAYYKTQYEQLLKNGGVVV